MALGLSAIGARDYHGLRSSCLLCLLRIVMGSLGDSMCQLHAESLT